MKTFVDCGDCYAPVYGKKCKCGWVRIDREIQGTAYHHPEPPQELWDPENIAQLKGLVLMKKLTPRLYDKLMAKVPFMAIAAENFAKTGWEPKGMFSNMEEVEIEL